jgi:hypothetical protein
MIFTIELDYIDYIDYIYEKIQCIAVDINDSTLFFQHSTASCAFRDEP